MDFALTEEQEFIQDTVRRFLARECPRDVARDLDEKRLFPEELLNRLAVTGLCALCNPEAYGGGGRNLLGAALVVEELSALCPALAGAFARVVLGGGWAISELGSEEQKSEWLPKIAQGALLFTCAAAESAVDGDPDEVQTMAAREGDLFRLNGAKVFAPLAHHADFILTLARTAPERTLSFFVVGAKAPGVRITEVEQIGLRGASACRVDFEDVRVSADDVLGGASPQNQARQQYRAIRAAEHVETAALALGIAQGAFAYAAGYAGERVQFGQPIDRFEAIQHMLVDMAIEVEASRLLLYRACGLADQGKPFEAAAAIAEAHAVGFARKAALQGLHILGGYGFTMEYDAQRYVRDSLALLSGSEPVEVLKSAVGEMLGIGARKKACR